MTTTPTDDLSRRAARLAARLDALPGHRRAHAGAVLERLERLVDEVVAGDTRPPLDGEGCC